MQASLLPSTATPPDSPTRLERPLAAIDRALTWLDGLIARWLPPELNPLAHAGAAANFSLCTAVVSGVALLVWYSPSVQFAYPSVAAMAGYTLGGIVRAVHRYSSDLAMLFVLVHALRIFFARKFTGPRWLPWVSGVGLVAVVWFIGWTGYWLIWDQPAQQVAVSSMQLLDGLPIFGEPLARLYVTDRLVPSLLFFVVFFLHMLVPLGIVVGLTVHLLRVNRARLFPHWKVGVALSAGLTLAAVLVPAPLDEAARMAVTAPAFTVDAWYLTPLALALRFQHAGLWIALFGSVGSAAALPWLLGRKLPVISYQAVAEESRCHACTQCVQDCPFDAITMAPRTDGKRFSSHALVDPAKCVGCGVCAGSCDTEGIGLPWFATGREETRIEHETGIALAAGAAPWAAFVAGDIDGGLARFADARWRERLPGYQVHFVPTASWVRAALVERLLKHGLQGVLVVRDARVEAAARDGGRWVAARLAGERAPVFRPERAGGSSNWRVIDYDPARPAGLVHAAAAFRGQNTREAASRPRGPMAALVAGALLTVAIAVATIAPSHLQVNNPAPAGPVFVLSFKALGDRMVDSAVDPAAEAAKPVHMRGQSTARRHRAAVIVRLTIDGATEERTYRAKGISQDGPALDEWRRPVTPGEHAVRVEIVTGPKAAPLRWDGTVRAEPRRLHVVTFDPTAGFRVE